MKLRTKQLNFIVSYTLSSIRRLFNVIFYKYIKLNKPLRIDSSQWLYCFLVDSIGTRVTRYSIVQRTF